MLHLHLPYRHQVSTVGHRRAAVVAHALPKRRQQPGRRRHSSKSDGEEGKQFSDEELIRELNSSHLWLPEADADFGLDDVAAHVASKNQAQVVDLNRPAGTSNSKGQPQGRRGAAAAAGAAAAGGGSDPQALSDIDPTSGQPMPDWVKDLTAAGFDVMSRDGQLFLQRGTVTPQPQQQQTQQQQIQQPPAPAPLPSSRVQQEQQQQQLQQPVLEVSDRSLKVHAEFDAAVWQEQIRKLQRGGSSSSSGADTQDDAEDIDAAAAAAGAWYATPAASSSSSQSAPPTAAGTATTSTTSSSTDETTTSNTTSSSSSSSRMTAAAIQRTLLGFSHPRALLALLTAVFPSWAANGGRLVSLTGPGVVAGPGPAEAAAALKGLALAALRCRLNGVQLQSLSREPLVAGLVEALRLTPPRSAPHQPPGLSRRLWSIARAYWMTSGAPTAAAAAQQLLLTAPQAGSVNGGQQGGGLAGLGSGSGGGGAAGLGPLLAALQARGGGAQLSRQQLAAAQALVAARGEDQLRRVAVVSALWGLASLGGALFFTQDVEALCQIAQAKFSRWGPSPSELSDVLWGLAHSRHWTPLLPQLEGCIMAAGGPPACTAAEAVTSIWAFAVLGHTPTQLLAQLDTQGWTVKPDRQQQQQCRRQQQQQQQKAPVSSSSSSSGTGSDRLSELRDSQLCTLAWSLACLQQVEGRLFRGVWVEVCSRGPSLAADTRQAVQLAQAALAVQLEGRYDPAELLPGEGTTQLLAAASAVFRQQGVTLAAQKAHSSYQRSIAGTLARLRVMHVLEDTTTGYAVDITIPSMKVAVEADGPSHFSRTPPHPSAAAGSGRLLQLGATAMKARHLSALGWAVVNVPYSEWDRQTDEQQRVAYLKARIAEARKRQQQGSSS